MDQPPQPANTFQTVPGFVDATLNPVIQPPTNKTQQVHEVPSYTRQLPNAIEITEIEIRNAVENYAKEHCCYGKPDPMKIAEIEMKNAFKYQLISFVETRETVWQFEPLFGQMLDGPGYVVGPWDYEMHPSFVFQDEVKYLRIPHTSSIRVCHVCFGRGVLPCSYCDALGFVICSWCHGRGRRTSYNHGHSYTRSCYSCSGTGRQVCDCCNGRGFVICEVCQGKCQLFFYLQLIVSWKNMVDECISDSTIIPKELLSKTLAKRCITEQHRRVAPFTDLPDQTLNAASRQCIDKHAQIYTMQGLILEQMQTVDIIRIAEISYNWNKKTGIFHVFGDSNDLYFPNYPNTCCCCPCCTIC